jgi:hypothetical protein
MFGQHGFHQSEQLPGDEKFGEAAQAFDVARVVSQNVRFVRHPSDVFEDA